MLAFACPNVNIPTIGLPTSQNYTTIDVPTSQNTTTKTWEFWYKLSDRTLVSEDGPTLALKVLVPALLVCGAVSLSLIYLELSTAKDEIMADGEEQEKVKEKGTQTEN